LCVVVLSLFDNTLNFLEVSKAGAGLNVLKVNIGVISVRKHVAEEEQKAFIGAKAFQNLDGLLGVNFVCILDTNFSTKLSVGAIGLHKVVHAGKHFVLTESTEEFNHDFFWNSV